MSITEKISHAAERKALVGGPFILKTKSQEKLYAKKQPTTFTECNAESGLAQNQPRQYQNWEKMLKRKLIVEERRIRTHRLCVRGIYLESIFS